MRRRITVGLVLAALVGWVAPAAAQDEGVLVFAAASLKNAMDEIAAGFGRQQQAKATVSYAASSALAKQVEQGAPADLFVSADLDWMDYLADKGLIDDGSRFDLLKNRIVLVAGRDSGLGRREIGRGFDLAGLLGDGRLAVGEVSSVPAGRYAKAALEKLGAWQGVEGRLAQAENVRAALALVARGEAPLGIVYATDAVAEENVQVVGTFPEDSHPPIIYPVALTEQGAGNAAAGDLLTYLRGAAARAAFERQGFTVMGNPGS